MSRCVTSVLAKGTFRQAARENVRVDVKNALAGVGPGVENQTKIPVGVFRGEIAPDRHHFGKQRGVPRGQFHDVRVGLSFRNNEQV